MGLITGPLEARAVDGFVDSFLADRRSAIVGGASAALGLSPEGALTFSAVHACAKVLAETVASLPLFVYRRLDRGKERAPGHPLYSLLHDQPNSESSSFEFRETAMLHLVLRGNAYCLKELDKAGRVIGLRTIDPRAIEVRVREKTREILYLVKPGYGEEPRMLSRKQVFHVRGMGSDGVVGYSPITLARNAIHTGMVAEEHGSRLFANDARPGGLLEHPGKLSEEAYKRLKGSWESSHAGASNAHKVDILEEGMK